MSKKKVYIIVNEHFDIMWRRCFDRDFEFKGKNYVSYADLEGFYIIDNIELCDKYPYYKFTVESVAVLRKFLEHHPEYVDKIKELFEEERIFVTMSGDNIVDSNMVQGESIVRNFLYGLEYLKDNFNFVPYGVDRNDAFGNSAQIPQIARGFNNKWVYHIGYTFPDNDYWRGLDGSTLYCYEPNLIGGTGRYYKYRPCPVCRGYKLEHCSACNDRRIDVPFMDKIRGGVRFDENKIENPAIPGYIRVGGEETLPIDDIIKWVEENKDKYDIEFTSFDTYKNYIEDKLERVDSVGDDELHSSMEINPNNTGTYVSRIKTKQRVRENENMISLAEALGVVLGLNGKKYNTEFITKMWEKLHFCIFHDAITATHIDAAYYELMDYHNQLKNGLAFSINQSKRQLTVKNDKTVTVMNLIGIDTVCTSTVVIDTNEDVTLADVNGNIVTTIKKEQTDKGVQLTFIAGFIKAFENKKFNIVPAQKSDLVSTNFELKDNSSTDAVLTNLTKSSSDDSNDEKIVTIENEYYQVTADNHGILSIFDKKLNKNICQKSEYYVGEFIFEHDEGSPWATLSTDMRRSRLSPVTNLFKINICSDYQELIFKCENEGLGGYACNCFSSECVVRLQKGDNKILFTTDCVWDTQNYRLRIAFPTPVSGKHIYEIPYGHIQRHPYENDILKSDGIESNWASAAGDWPAINWAGIESDDVSVALFNKGTPSYQINTDENGTQNIYLSVLRSPSVGTYLHDPGKSYSMTDYDGMRDAGEHHFEYAFTSYADGFDKNTVVADSLAYNVEAISLNGDVMNYVMPTSVSDDVRISSVKHSQKGDMLIYRMVEFHGNDSKAEITIPQELGISKVYEMNLNEEIIAELPIVNNKVNVDFGKFKIKTIAFKLN